jgi:hypothetical protein
VLLARNFGMRVTSTAALEQPGAEPGADPLARRQLRARLGERPLARLAAVPPLAPQQVSDPTHDRQIEHSHHVAILDRQRPPPGPPTTRRPRDQLDLELKPPAVIDHRSHDQPIDTDKTANVILHPLLLLVRVFDNARLARSSGCLLSEPQPRSISKTRELTL